MEVTADTAQRPDIHRWWLSQGDWLTLRITALNKANRIRCLDNRQKAVLHSSLTINLKEQFIIYSNLIDIEGRQSKFLLVNLIQRSHTTTKSKDPSASKGLTQRDWNWPFKNDDWSKIWHEWTIVTKQKQTPDIENRLKVAKGGEWGPGRTGSLGLADMQTSRNRMDKQGLLCNTGNNTQYPVINHHRKECEKEHIIIMESFCYTAEMNTNCNQIVNQLYFNKINLEKWQPKDFPGPVAKALCSQRRRPRFDPWSGN